jgi:spore coat protein A, manganese oxidase
VPADYDGDGKTDIAVWRGVGENADNGFWYILQSSTGIVRTQKWGIGNQGISGDVPVPGDYDGDGKTDLAVVRQGNPSVWYVLRSSNNSFFAVPFGASNFFDEYLPILKTR